MLCNCMTWSMLSLCLYYNLYVYTTISMSILQSLCKCCNLYVYTTISMSILQSLCLYYNLYVYTTISVSIQNLYVYTTISMVANINFPICLLKCHNFLLFPFAFISFKNDCSGSFERNWQTAMCVFLNSSKQCGGLYQTWDRSYKDFTV